MKKFIVCISLFGLAVFTLVACGGSVGGSESGEDDPVVATKTWGTAELIEADDTGAEAPQIAFDRSGNAVAVWSQYDGTRFSLWAKTYSAGTGWGTAELIEADDSGDAVEPQIAFDGSGNAIVVWGLYVDASLLHIWANTYTAGTGWGTAELIETDDTGYAIYPQIAFDGSGNAVAVWSQYDGTRTNIWANTYTAGTGWGTAELIETDNAGYASFPQIAFDGSGNAVAVWSQSDGILDNIWANTYSTGTGWGTAELIATDDAGDALYPEIEPQIAFDGSGNAVAVWEHDDGTQYNYNIWANTYTAGTGWGTAELIEADAMEPQIAFDGSGTAIAVGSKYDGTRGNIFANTYTAGTGWGTAELIEADNSASAIAPQIAFDGSGNAVAVWSQYVETWGGNILANTYTAGTGWGTAELIEADDSAGSHDPQIAFDGSGIAVAVWSQNDGTRDSIWANTYR